jgi:signal transduction histidine kinase
MRSTACLDELFGSSREGMLLLDAEGMVVWCNGIVGDFFGLAGSELTGSNFPALLLHGAAPMFAQPEEIASILQQAETGPDPLEIPCHILPGPACRERWLQLTVQQLHFGPAGDLLLRFMEVPAQQPDSVFASGQNETLPSAQEFLAIFNGIPDPVLHVSPDGVLLFANRAASTIAADKGELIGKCCFTVLRGRDTPCAGCPVDKSRRSGLPEVAQINAEGDRIVEVRVVPFPAAEGRPGRGFMVQERDVTEHLRLRKIAFQTMPLALLGELAAGVAHEINNPATGIINCAQLLTDRLDAGDREIAQRILREGKRVAAIVRNLLSFARIDGGKDPGVKIEDELTDLLSLTRAQMRKERVILNLCLAPDLPAVTANPQQIRQVFLNLINNARYALNQKFPGQSEEKVLQIRGERQTCGGVRFIFHDSGAGIPQDLLPRIFRPFFTTKPVGRGTGLGLSLSRAIIVDHGGVLEIESVEGQFTRAIVELPAD